MALARRHEAAEVGFFQLSDAASAGRDGRLALGCWPADGGLVFALADGLGHAVGALASALALDAVAAGLEGDAEALPIATRLRRAVQLANVELYHKRVTVPDLRELGAVLTASAVVGGMLVAVHVGDCRLLLLRDGRLSQLTKDHGEPTSADVWGAERAVARVLGPELVPALDLLRLALRPGDVLCQCPARVHAALGAELGELLGAHPPPAACRAVVRRARAEGVADAGAQVAVVVRGAPDARRGRWLWR
jgi:hypothetical protein